MDFLNTGKLLYLPKDFYLYCKHTKNVLINLDLGFYWFWVVLRIALTLLPQTGYIHPDEYFQTVEVFAGNAFGTHISLPWEFNATFPVRSTPLLYMSVYTPFSLLKRVSESVETYFGFNLINHYTLLVVPRLSLCAISFISDICLFKICYNFGQNYKERLIIYGSSYVCLVFMTRTFTNTIEIACFNVLLCLVAMCMAESEMINYQCDYLQEEYNEASTISHQVKILRLIKFLPKHSLKRCIPIALVTVAGFFNRPTFVFYAVTPIFYWFQRGLTIRSTFLLDFHVRFLVFIIYCIPVAAAFILLDSAYYGYLTWGDVLSLEISSENFVVTPFNFIKYNLDPSNLSQHGLHPRFLHFFVNVPLLFNVLGFSGMLVIGKLVYRSGISNWTLLPKSQSITGMMTLSFLVPVLCLSVFPHQEPRFITPILLPLIFLYSHLVDDFEEQYKSVVPFRKRHPKVRRTTGIFKYPIKCISYFEKATENIDNRYNINGRYLSNLMNQEVVEASYATKPSQKMKEEKSEEEENEVKKKEGKPEQKDQKIKKKSMMKIWFLLNAVSVFIFGFLHQGGIYGLSKHFNQELASKQKYNTYHIITSHVYSVPIHLFSVKRNYKSKNTNFVMYELGSDNLENINLKLTTILKLAESKKKSVRRNYRIFYAFPSSRFNEFKFAHQYYSSNYSFQILDVFFPHLSIEAFPNFRLNVSEETEFRLYKFKGVFTIFDCLLLRYVFEFLYQFGLMLIEVTLPS